MSRKKMGSALSAYDIEYSSDYRFDSSYYILYHKLLKLEYRYGIPDKLEQLVLPTTIEITKEQLFATEHVLYDNLKKFFAVCKLVGIKQVFIGKHELVTLECLYGHYPAIWIALRACTNGAFTSCCGNSNQVQISDPMYFLPIEYLNKAWDIDTGEAIDVAPFRRFMVVNKLL